MKKDIILLILVIFISGCAKEEIIEDQKEEQRPENLISDILEETEQETSLTNPLDVPRVNSAAHLTISDDEFIEEEDTPAICYLGAFAMLVLFDDKNLDLADVIAYSGIGSYANYDSRMGLNNGYKEKSIILAAQNLGYTYNIGVKSEGKADSFLANFKSSASNIKYFNNENEALDYIKQIIDSGKPVEVHLNVYYVIDEFRKFSNMWVNGWDKGHWSHFMTVTGYSDDFIYINDPTDPDLTIKNMKVPVENFLEAWKNGDKTVGAQLGPYWMLYLKDKAIKKSVKEITSWNKEISSDAVSNIKKAKQGDYAELGVGRMEFGKFLERNGYKEAGKLYKEAASIYLQDPEDSILLKEVGEKEEEARGLLK